MTTGWEHKKSKIKKNNMRKKETLEKKHLGKERNQRSIKGKLAEIKDGGVSQGRT